MPLSRIQRTTGPGQSTVPGRTRRREKFSDKDEFESAVAKIRKKLQGLDDDIEYHLILTAERPEPET
jgi:hypothetical protein